MFSKFLLLTLCQHALTQSDAQFSTVSSVLHAIATDLANLDSAVNAYSGSSDAANLQSLSEIVLNDLTNGDTIIKQQQPLTLNDGASLLAPLNELESNVNSTISDLIAQQMKLVATCEGETVLNDLQQQLSAANAFASDLLLLVPSGGERDLGSSYSITISSYIQSGVDAYATATAAPASCTPTTTSSSSTATGSAAPTSTSTSTTSSSISTTPTSSNSPTSTAPTSTSPTGTAGEEAAYSSISSFLDAIASSVVSLDNDVKAFQGINQVAAVQEANDALLNLIKSDTPPFANFPELSEGDSINLVTPVNTLGSDVKAVVDDLVSKQSVFVGACVGPEVLQDLEDQLDATVQFAGALVQHIYAPLQGEGSALSSSITSLLVSGVSAYQAQSTVPASCGGVNTTPTNGGGGGGVTSSTGSIATSTGSSSGSGGSGGSGSGGSGGSGSGSSGGSGGSGSGTSSGSDSGSTSATDSGSGTNPTGSSSSGSSSGSGSGTDGGSGVSQGAASSIIVNCFTTAAIAIAVVALFM